MNTLLVLFIAALSGLTPPSRAGFEVVLRPGNTGLMSPIIQKAIDSCSSKGGGTVRFTKGTYLTGTLELKNNVSLFLETGTLLQGSDKYADYSNDAFIFGRDLKNVSISGKGIIDGVDCYNPKGEEGFRGPHCIRLINCSNIALNGITIKNSANWAINCRYCSFGNVTNVTILGGHDGLHTRFCNNFTVKSCDFRTGDDAFAGNDNADFHISDCLVNTSCNGFRMGCLNLRVERCTLWGPGEYMHKIQKRNNMLSAFVHFSPTDQKPKLISGNWVIKDVTVKNVDIFYMYNYRNGLWQTGQPARNIEFRNIKASGLLRAFSIDGGKDSLFSMKIRNSTFTCRTGSGDPEAVFEGARLKSSLFFYANAFDQLQLDNVTFGKPDSPSVMECENGNSILMKKTLFPGKRSEIPYKLSGIKSQTIN